MIESFANSGTEDIFNGINSVEARRLLPRDLWRVAFRKLDQIDSATQLDDLRVPSGNRFEALKGERIGQYSIRIDDQFRVCFQWRLNGARAVEVVDYH